MFNTFYTTVLSSDVKRRTVNEIYHREKNVRTTPYKTRTKTEKEE